MQVDRRIVGRKVIIGLKIAQLDNDMIYLAYLHKKIMQHIALLLGILLYFGVQSSAFGQVDSFGTLDRMYIEKASAIAGSDVVVSFYMQNDETISSGSVPLTYNTGYLTLNSIDFTGSRIDYIANKMVTPSQAVDIDGHFLVTFFTLSEDPVVAGDGLLFTAHFTLDDSASNGDLFAIDTLFYPPGGEMIFVEATQAVIIRPQFDAGSVAVEKENFVPLISATTSESVLEGENLSFVVSASDANNDSLVFVCSNKPTGAIFEMIDNNSARFSWDPDFVGPYSSDGSPFKLKLLVSDGSSSAETEMLINVVNKNRKPTISTVSNMDYESGDLVQLVIDASDADFDMLTWETSLIPNDAIFTEGAQATFNWQTTIDDTGSFPVQFIVTDPSGFSDTLASAIYLTAVELYELSITSAEGSPDEKVSVSLNLDNKLPIGSFILLVHYDPSALSLISVSNDTSRTSSFEYFSYTNNADNAAGNIRIVGIADLSGNNNSYLASGTGSIVDFDFRIFGNLSLSGLNIPMTFKFIDMDDNTFTDSLGVKVVQEAITYINGSILITSLGEINTGDINLNGIAFEISDAIYFTNYFMNPFTAPFNPLQYANSDINHDNIVASIADLVALINVITKGGQGKIAVGEGNNLNATLLTEKNDDGIRISYESDFEIGGLLITFAGDDVTADNVLNLTDNMTLDFASGAESNRILVYSLDGNQMPDGNHAFVQLDLESDIEILSVEVSSSDGVLATVETSHKEMTLPTTFTLSQNYPNPFNPSTQISFSLPEQTDVSLDVYNVLGKKVRVLINESFAAGNHTVVWDGRNDAGAEVASGIYFYRMMTEMNHQTKKMLFLK